MNNSNQQPNSKTRVKICGIRDVANAFAAAEAGADMIGFVFAPSKRRVSPEQAADIIVAVRERFGEQEPLMVGLFVNEDPRRMNEIAALCRLDMAQLSGDEEPDAALLDVIGVPVIRMLRVKMGADVAGALALAQAWSAAAAQDAQSVAISGPTGSRLLIGIDSYHPDVYGGAGQTADHSLAAQLAPHFPLMLAGGLNAANVADGIAAVKPWAVDVSSGVEEQGAKSPLLIREFIERVTSDK